MKIEEKKTDMRIKRKHGMAKRCQGINDIGAF